MSFVPLREKNCVTVTIVFQKISDKSGRKPNEIWIDKGSEFYNKSMRLWLQDNVTEMYSAHNKRNLLLPKDLSELW